LLLVIIFSNLIILDPSLKVGIQLKFTNYQLYNHQLSIIYKFGTNYLNMVSSSLQMTSSKHYKYDLNSTCMQTKHNHKYIIFQLQQLMRCDCQKLEQSSTSEWISNHHLTQWTLTRLLTDCWMQTKHNYKISSFICNNC
jgi:hypothetical protein